MPLFVSAFRDLKSFLRAPPSPALLIFDGFEVECHNWIYLRISGEECGHGRADHLVKVSGANACICDKGGGGCLMGGCFLVGGSTVLPPTSARPSDAYSMIFGIKKRGSSTVLLPPVEAHLVKKRSLQSFFSTLQSASDQCFSKSRQRFDPKNQ